MVPPELNPAPLGTVSEEPEGIITRPLEVNVPPEAMPSVPPLLMITVPMELSEIPEGTENAPVLLMESVPARKDMARNVFVPVLATIVDVEELDGKLVSVALFNTSDPEPK